MALAKHRSNALHLNLHGTRASKDELVSVESQCHWTYQTGDDFEPSSPSIGSDSACSSEGSCYQQRVPFSPPARRVTSPADTTASGKDGALASFGIQTASIGGHELARLPSHPVQSPPTSPWALSSSCPTSPATSTTNADDLGGISPFTSSKCSFGDDLACLQSFRFPPFERPISPKTTPGGTVVSSAPGDDNSFQMRATQPAKVAEEHSSFLSQPPSLNFRRRSIVPLPLEGAMNVPDPPANAVSTNALHCDSDPAVVFEDLLGRSRSPSGTLSTAEDTLKVIEGSDPHSTGQHRSLSRHNSCSSPLGSPSSLSAWSRTGAAAAERSRRRATTDLEDANRLLQEQVSRLQREMADMLAQAEAHGCDCALARGVHHQFHQDVFRVTDSL